MIKFTKNNAVSYHKPIKNIYLGWLYKIDNNTYNSMRYFDGDKFLNEDVYIKYKDLEAITVYYGEDFSFKIEKISDITDDIVPCKAYGIDISKEKGK